MAEELATFSEVMLRAWSACLGEIATDPFPRFGTYVERILPIAPFPFTTYLYEITEETSISGQRVFAFVSEFLPEYSPVYFVDEYANDVSIFYLRPNR